MLINDFYANREIFITGGSGFLGKALIEKLLRDLPKIKVLYILLRGKKLLNVEQRLELLKKDKVFDRINRECPKVLDKLYAIQGDSKELGLGISQGDLELLKNVSIIFHMAANVKFDDPLRSSILLNTRGTYELVKIAEKLKNLVVFVHCSTAYCNPFENTIEEKVYKIDADWRKTIKIAETYDEDTINLLSQKYTDHYPNSYTFTKNLSEQLIQEYSSKLPMLVFRPSIVLSAYREPTPGWIDNMNGPISAMVAFCIGVLPVGVSRKDLQLDCVPIDIVTKLTIVAAYKRGMQSLRKESFSSDVEVVNCASGGIFNVTMHDGSEMFARAVRKNPLENCIWYYDTPIITACYYNFLFKIIFMSMPLGIVMDIILRLKGQQARLFKLYRRIVYTIKAVGFFSLKSYCMINKNMLDLDTFVPNSELKTFGVKSEIDDLNEFEYFEHAVRGVKYNFFNEPIEATDATKNRYRILRFVNKSIKLFFAILLIRYLWSIVSKF